MPAHVVLLGLATIVFGFLFFMYMGNAGRLAKRNEALTAEAEEAKKKLDALRDELKGSREGNTPKTELAELRSKYKSAKKDAFEADAKVKEARDAQQSAELEEQRALAEAARLREELAAVRAESAKAAAAVEAAKGEAAKLRERVSETEEKLRERPKAEPRREAAPAPAPAAPSPDRITKLEKKLRDEREAAMERARALERTKKRLEAVNRAYDVLRGQYHVMHDRLLQQMGQEGEADDHDHLLKEDDRQSRPPQKAEAAAPASEPAASVAAPPAESPSVEVKPTPETP